MALALIAENRLDDAAREVDAVVPRAEALAPTSFQRARVALARGTLARLRGDPSAAMQRFQPLADSSDPAPKWQRERMRAWVQIGWVQLEQGAAEQAIASFERALKEFERLETHPTPARADAQLGLASAHLALGDRAKALALLGQVDTFWRGFDPSNRHAALAADALGRAKASPSR
jgi:tetratricopeptide (TPR) repeat protein